MKTVVIMCLCVAMVTGDILAPLHTTRESVPNKFIVKMKDGISRTSFKRTFEGQLDKHGILVDAVKRTLENLNMLVVDIPEDKVNAIRSIAGVEYVEEDGVVYEDAVGSWGLDRIDQDDLPLDSNYTTPSGDGAGVDVYVLDTGVRYTHEEFDGSRAHFGHDVFDDGWNGDDCRGHGTHCAGTIGGKTYGVAKKVDIWSVRVLGCTGSGTWAGVIEGMDWVIAHKKGPSVASMSLGGGSSLSVDNAVSRLFNAGVTVVVSAGNNNYPSCWNSPAGAPKAITVGSTTDTDARSYFSNYGTCVDIFAPGSSIISAGIESDTSISTKSGTSMACPHVAGAAALELGKNPTLSPEYVANNLVNKALVDMVVNVGPQSVNKLLRV